MADITDILQKLDTTMSSRAAKDEATMLMIEALKKLNEGPPSTIKAGPQPTAGAAPPSHYRWPDQITRKPAGSFAYRASRRLVTKPAADRVAPGRAPVFEQHLIQRYQWTISELD